MSTESMESRIYDLMDWARIEAVVYAEEDKPGEILGPQITDDGILVQAFFPDEETASVKLADGRTIPMVLEDEAGYFAVMLDGKTVPTYSFVIGEGKEAREVKDPYAYPGRITEHDEKRFAAGNWKEAYTILGAHVSEVNGTVGTYFAVWAPNAIRVSVVGDFNNWDGRVNPMNRLDSGIYELFVPGVTGGDLYKYELKLKTGLVYLKTDPAASAYQPMPQNASIVEETGYAWTDDVWMEARGQAQQKDQPIAIYEVHPGTWKKHEDGTDYTYRELAPLLADYVSEMGYTHVELMPVTEYPDDASLGYAPGGFFAPSSRYGTPDDFRAFVDIMHQEGINVILDWVPNYFAPGDEGLASFDGTCLYEHLDPRQGIHPVKGTKIFNYGRKEVVSFLLASAEMWLKEFHADGLRLSDVASMVYLDFGRKTGEWVANMYGGNENLEAIRFLKDLNRMIHKDFPGVLTIAEESTGFPMVTGDPEKEGLGFDYKWNNGCMDDFMNYIQLDPYFRGAHQDDLTLSMVYNYSEKFLLSMSHELLGDGRKSLFRQMPSLKPELKAANLRLMYAYMMMHPGKKLFFMGQDFGQNADWAYDLAINRGEIEKVEQAGIARMNKTLLNLYQATPALYELDEKYEGFEWVSDLDWKRNMIVFLRKGRKEEDTLLVVCNFSNVEYDNFRVGVPFPGKYKEIFNSDSADFGGTGVTNPRVKLSAAVECDERRDSIKIKVPPLAVAAFRYTALDPEKKTPEKKAPEKKAPEKKAPAKAVPEKKTAAKKTAAKSAVKNSVPKKAEAAVKAAGSTVQKAAGEAVKAAGSTVQKAAGEAVKKVAGAAKKTTAKAASKTEPAKKATAKKATAKKAAPKKAAQKKGTK